MEEKESIDLQTLILTTKIGLFFANSDGVYDEREKKVISSHIKELTENDNVSDEIKTKLTKVFEDTYSLEEIIIETKEFLSQFNEKGQETIIDKLSNFIQKVINADGKVLEIEEKYFNEWKSKIINK